MADLTLDYYFDPLCGWCYASAPALQALAQTWPDALAMRPSGLFCDPRPVADIADHARRNDDRIAALTGQRFTEAYHQGVMRKRGGIFRSDYLTRALVALGQIDGALEPLFQHAAQIARYVEGRDTGQADVVADVAVAVAARGGVPLEAAAFADRLMRDADLKHATDARIADTQRRQQHLPRGVPLLVVTHGARAVALNGEAIYGDPGDLLTAITALGEAAAT
ncbi:DsbA family protein [Phaeovulum sp. W22_SRMD_FR3]|uniref:DsbA family protein n=1 Tax=Phaeovulum sp. W22_SRMD_FR3 TaxID=3240274 RepID=UPI003F9CE5F4